MQPDDAGPRRLYATIGALIGLAALALQLYLLLAAATAQGRTVPGVLVQFASYFTILSNGLVVLCYLGAGGRGFFARPGVQSAVALYIAAVGLVYAVILARLWSPQGLQFIVDAALHYTAPVLYLGFWLLFVEKADLRYPGVLRWLVFPIAYCAYALLRGALSGLYPYPFLEAGTLGYARVAGNIAILVALFSLVGLAMIAGGRGLARLRVAASAPLRRET
jgi:hypothetical protein